MAELAFRRLPRRTMTRTARTALILGLTLTACGARSFDPDSLGAQVLADLSPLEVDVLRDKAVSEFEIIITNTELSTCLMEAEADDVFVDNATASYSIQGEPSPEFEVQADACEAQVDVIAAVWFMQNDDTIFETPLPGLEAALERLRPRLRHVLHLPHESCRTLRSALRKCPHLRGEPGVAVRCWARAARR